MQWTKYGGFTSNNPWMKQNKNTKYINVEDNLNNKNSIFYYYKKLIEIRKKYKVVSEGLYVPYLKDYDRVYAFKRLYKDEELLVINNLYGEKTRVDIENIGDYKILISNYKENNLKENLNLREYEAIVLYKKA